jgi:transcriptional regulator with GAF, ATPase, and Fis domain
LAARAIHERSRRCNRPFIKVNCAAIPRELFESEFFGHVKGAFTGAHSDRSGRFELADGGTLFLDEVGEIPIELQSKLLGVLQEGCFERLGDGKPRRVDVRIVAATNRALAQEIAAQRFRQDLYYRLNVFPIELPPLRERREDIPLLAQHLLALVGKKLNRPGLRLTPANIHQLQHYDWPGNVRELQNLIERAVIVARRGQALYFPIPADAHSSAHANPLPAPDASVPTCILTEAMRREQDRRNLIAALEQARGKIAGPGGAAELLGIKSTTLKSRIKALGIRIEHHATC